LFCVPFPVDGHRLAWLSFSPSNAFCSDSKALIANDSKPKKLALLVGINDYPYVTKLRGAVNDVENMRQLLVERFGFPDDGEHMLVQSFEGEIHLLGQIGSGHQTGDAAHH
jgi:hypothetical protein